jgi:hypothetical protein
MCPQLPRLSPEYSHKAGLQTVITGMPLQIRPVTRGGHAGPVTMGRIARGPLSWTRPHCGMTSSPVFVWCRSSEGCPCLFCLSDQRLQRRLRAKGGVFAFAPTATTTTACRHLILIAYFSYQDIKTSEFLFYFLFVYIAFIYTIIILRTYSHMHNNTCTSSTKT